MNISEPGMMILLGIVLIVWTKPRRLKKKKKERNKDGSRIQ